VLLGEFLPCTVCACQSHKLHTPWTSMSADHMPAAVILPKFFTVLVVPTTGHKFTTAVLPRATKLCATR
jgi:hypothetical protein